MLKQVLSAKPKKKKGGDYSLLVETDSKLLDGGTYFFSVESTNAAKGGRAYYEIAVDQDASKFYDSAPTSALLAPQDALPSGALAASSADPALTDGMLSIQDSVLLA
jgi:hypothetical protein